MVKKKKDWEYIYKHTLSIENGASTLNIKLQVNPFVGDRPYIYKQFTVIKITQTHSKTYFKIKKNSYNKFLMF